MKKGKTDRGFQFLTFKDSYDHDCSIGMSSAIDATDRGLENPGSSYLWVGVIDANPLVMAKDAKKHGVKTKKETGWVPYPIPEDVLLTTQMHLSREQVADLVDVFKHWLKTNELPS